MQFGRYYEEFEPGDIYKHWPGKTVTEYDDHLFCLLTMNHHPLHLDAHYAARDHPVRQERRGRQLHLLAGARDVGSRCQRQGDRQPRDRVAAPRRPDVSRRHDLRRDRWCSTRPSRSPRTIAASCTSRPRATTRTARWSASSGARSWCRSGRTARPAAASSPAVRQLGVRESGSHAQRRQRDAPGGERLDQPAEVVASVARVGPARVERVGRCRELAADNGREVVADVVAARAAPAGERPT